MLQTVYALLPTHNRGWDGCTANRTSKVNAPASMLWSAAVETETGRSRWDNVQRARGCGLQAPGARDCEYSNVGQFSPDDSDSV